MTQFLHHNHLSHVQSINSEDDTVGHGIAGLHSEAPVSEAVDTRGNANPADGPVSA